MVVISSKIVEQVKTKVIQIASNSDSYDDLDIEKLHTNAEMIERFVLDYQVNNANYLQQQESSVVSSITANVLDTLAWRKEIGLTKMKDSDFPIEFYQLDFFKKGKQTNGQLLLLINTGRLQRLSTWSNVWIHFIVHECEKMTIDFLADPNFLSKPRPLVLVDSTEVSLAHMDLKFVLTIIPIFLKHYAQAFESIWLYELPYFSLHLKPILIASLPRRITRLVHFTDRKNLVKDLGNEVPVEYGGQSTHPLDSIEPTNPGNLFFTGKTYGIDESEIKKMQEAVNTKLKKIGKL